MENWGIYIDEIIVNENMRFFYLSIGKHDKEYRNQEKLLFATNPEIRERVKKINPKEPALIGFIGVQIDKNDKVMHFSPYYPTGKTEFVLGDSPRVTHMLKRKPKPHASIKQREMLKGIGLASLVELVIQKQLLKKFKDYDVKSRPRLPRGRMKQLLDRKRFPGQQRSLREEAEATKKQVIGQHHRRKAKRAA